MSKRKAPHHKGRYDTESRRVVAAAKADPYTTCARCRRTLEQVRQAKLLRGSTSRVYWCAGHVNRAEVNGPLRPECSECSGREGQRITTQTNKRRNARPRRRTPPTQHTRLTW